MSEYVNKLFPSLSRQIFSPSWLTKSRGTPHLSQGSGRHRFSEIGASDGVGDGSGETTYQRPFETHFTPPLEPPEVILPCAPCFEGPEPGFINPFPSPSTPFTPGRGAINRFRSSSLSGDERSGATLSPTISLGLEAAGQSKKTHSLSDPASPPCFDTDTTLPGDGVGLGIFGLPDKPQSFISDTPVLRSDVGLAPNHDNGCASFYSSHPPTHLQEPSPFSEAASNPFSDESSVPGQHVDLLSVDDDSRYGRPLSSIPECDSWQEEVGDALRLSAYSKSNGSLTRYSGSSRCVSPATGGSSSASSCFRSSIHSSDCGHDSIFSNLDSDCSSRYEDPFCGGRTAHLRRFSSASSLFPPSIHGYDCGNNPTQQNLGANDVGDEEGEGNGSGGWCEPKLESENPFMVENDVLLYSA